MKVLHLLILWILFLTLYPTWFRWKTTRTRIINNIFELYIPHGSDERTIRETSILSTVTVYIPHGSDESEKWDLKQQPLSRLYPTWFRWKAFLESLPLNHIKEVYIPHGSDERGNTQEGSTQPQEFISHMVQMKATVIWCSDLPILSFISHMVQMKALKVKDFL